MKKKLLLPLILISLLCTGFSKPYIDNDLRQLEDIMAEESQILYQSQGYSVKYNPDYLHVNYIVREDGVRETIFTYKINRTFFTPNDYAVFSITSYPIKDNAEIKNFYINNPDFEKATDIGQYEAVDAVKNVKKQIVNNIVHEDIRYIVLNQPDYLISIHIKTTENFRIEANKMFDEFLDSFTVIGAK